MNVPIQTKPALWGIAGGAIARGDFVEKGGWATLPGTPADRVSVVPKACAVILVAT